MSIKAVQLCYDKHVLQEHVKQHNNLLKTTEQKCTHTFHVLTYLNRPSDRRGHGSEP